MTIDPYSVQYAKCTSKNYVKSFSSSYLIIPSLLPPHLLGALLGTFGPSIDAPPPFTFLNTPLWPSYLSRGALRLPAARLTANSRLCVNLALEIWLLLGINVATTYFLVRLCYAVACLFTSLHGCLIRNRVSILTAVRSSG